MKLGSSRPFRRDRTFNGCATCRARKIKCGLEKPTCLACRKRGVPCAGFEAKIQYVYYDTETEEFTWPPGDKESKPLSSRRPLFTEHERALMSDMVVRAMDRQTIDGVLDKVDRPSRSDRNMSYRPFNVIHFESQGMRDDVQAGMLHDLASETSLQSASTEDANAGALVLSGEIGDFNFIDMSGIGPISDVGLGSSNSVFMDTFWSDETPLFGFDSVFDFAGPATMSPPLYPIMTQSSDRGVPEQASFLLDHYRQQMLKLFSPKGSQKPPWAILHLPNALATLSELTVYGSASHARVSLLYSLLAMSAFHLDRVNLETPGTTDFWWQLGDKFQNSARKEIKEALLSETSGPKKSKYKDMLMSLLSMVTITVVSGRQEESRSFLLDAEHFILIRGISKPNKSRKVNLLHQIYLFLRVIEESTHVYPRPDAISLESYCRCIDPTVRNKLFPSLRTQAALLGRNLDAIIDVRLDEELAGDIRQGHSLFQEVYGIPVELISLLSRATWLANELWFRQITHSFTSGNDDLKAYAQELEDAILAWSMHPSTDPARGPDTAPLVMHHLLLAIHNALILFFYRRIYELNAQALQPFVQRVADHLFAIEQEKVQSNLVFNGIAWPGFIAAAEALDPDLRRRLSVWLRSSGKSSGFRNFDVAANVAERVWAVRDQGHIRTGWVNLVVRQQLSLVMT